MDRTNPSGTPARPVRTCVGCRERANKSDLVRVVAIVDGATTVVAPDLRGSAAGRGAHLHPTDRCLERATRRKAFGRALRTAGRIDLGLLTAFVRAHSKNDLSQGKADEEKWSTRS
ncbi:MAG: YlxR family protein [Nocardioidaceae bacterium]